MKDFLLAVWEIIKIMATFLAQLFVPALFTHLAIYLLFNYDTSLGGLFALMLALATFRQFVWPPNQSK